METFRNNLFVPIGYGCKEMFFLKRTPALIEPVDRFDHVHSPLSTIDIQTYASGTIQLLKLLETGASNMARPLVRLEHCFYT